MYTQAERLGWEDLSGRIYIRLTFQIWKIAYIYAKSLSFLLYLCIRLLDNLFCLNSFNITLCDLLLSNAIIKDYFAYD